MPYLWRGALPEDGDLDALFAPLLSEEERSDVYPNHPWLLRTDMIREVGYYDPVMSPWCASSLGWLPLLLLARAAWPAAGAAGAAGHCRAHGRWPADGLRAALHALPPQGAGDVEFHLAARG